MNSDLITTAVPNSPTDISSSPQTVFLSDEGTGERFFGFFTAHIRNRNTRLAYYKASCQFSDCCESRVLHLVGVKPAHVAAYIKWLGLPEPKGQGLAKPSVKQQLAALRMLFDWLVVGHVIEHNPAHAMRGPKYSQKKGKTPVLDRDEARALLAVIDTSTLTGLRDRALIGTMIYTFARVGAVLQMNVGDYFTEGGVAGFACTRRAGRSMKRPAITSWKPFSMNTSRRRGSRPIRTGRYSAPQDG